MSEAERAELLTLLGEAWRCCPEMRFGQLIANLAVAARGPAADSVWDLEDAELREAARWQAAAAAARNSAAAGQAREVASAKT